MFVLDEKVWNEPRVNISTGEILNSSSLLIKWEFAIYKYSSEGYDDDEFFFPGAGNVDGTVEGAMLAGLEAYP